MNLDTFLTSPGLGRYSRISLGSLILGYGEKSGLTEGQVPQFIGGIPIRTFHVTSNRKPDSNDLRNEGSRAYVTEK